MGANRRSNFLRTGVRCGRSHVGVGAAEAILIYPIRSKIEDDLFVAGFIRSGIAGASGSRPGRSVERRNGRIGEFVLDELDQAGGGQVR